MVIDSAFSFDMDGGAFFSSFLDYLQEDPSIAYSTEYCAEVRNVPYQVYGAFSIFVLPNKFSSVSGNGIYPQGRYVFQ